jgi:hypothetical protein
MSTGQPDPDPTASYDPPRQPQPQPPTPAASRRDETGRTGTIVFGLIVIGVGLWFFADQTLGFEMPQLRWSELWPVILIVIGGWILLSSMRRRR